MFIKIKNLFILLLCFLYFPFKKRKINNGDIENILIIQSAKLGDMICTTPMFRAVKEKYPKCELVVMGDKINKDVLEFNSDVDKYIVIDRGSFWQNLKKVKEIKPDFACITSPNFLNLASLYLASVPVISTPKIENGWSPYETKTYKILRNIVISIPHRMGSYAPREYLKLLEPIGIFSDDIKKHLNFSDEASKRIESFIVEKGIDKTDFIVGISPSAGNKIKNWSEEKFAKVADYVFKKYGAKVIIIGGKNDEDEVSNMLSFLDEDTKIINTCGVFNIDELKALISKMNMFIAVDTGPIYIAEAFGVPTIDIIGPMDEREQPPLGNLNKTVFLKERKKSQLHIMNARVYDFKEAKRQVDEITVEMVINTFEDLYEKLRKK